MKITPVAQSPLPLRRFAAATEEESVVKDVGEKVSVSEEAMKRLADENSKIELQAKYHRLYSIPSMADKVFARFDSAGRSAFLQTPPPEHYSAEEASRFRSTLEYLTITHRTLSEQKNPFYGLDRASLSAIVEDEEHYTAEERVAADRAKATMDNQYFVMLIKHGNTTHDWRPMSKGYLEYLDHLTPMERLRYPENERDRVLANLARDEKEAGGPLPEDFSLWKYMQWNNKGRLQDDDLLKLEASASSLATPASSDEAGAFVDQGSSRLL